MRSDALDVDTADAHGIAISVRLTPKQAGPSRDLVQPVPGFLYRPKAANLSLRRHGAVLPWEPPAHHNPPSE